MSDSATAFGPTDRAGARDLVGGWGPSSRARRAETLAQLILSDASVAAPLRALVQEAATATGAENAQLSIISTRQIAVVVERGARSRPNTTTTPTGATFSLEDTICAVSVRADAPIAIPDTRLDDRVASIPAVVGGIIGAYLGHPVRLADDSVIGVLCVYDRDPHEWSPDDTGRLEGLAGGVAAHLDRLAAASTERSA